MSVRLRPEAYGELEQKAHAAGRTLAAYTREKLFEEEPVPAAKIDEIRKELAGVKRELAKLAQALSAALS